MFEVSKKEDLDQGMELESSQETRTCYINGLLLIALVNLWLHVHGGQHNDS